jgi:hypothetical protein
MVNVTKTTTRAADNSPLRIDRVAVRAAARDSHTVHRMLDFILKVLLYLPWLLMAFLAFKFCQFRLAGFAKPNVDASGKWVLVTGAASGIGRATALAVLRYGGSVYAADVNEPALKQAFAEYGPDRVVRRGVFCCWRSTSLPL